MSKNIAILARLKNLISTNVKKTIYNSIIAPHFHYGSVAWGSSKSCNFRRLYVLQKRAIRIICKSKYNAHTNPLFKQLALLTIEDIYKQHCVKIAIKRLKNVLPPYLSSLLPVSDDIHNYTIRNVIHIRKTTYKKQIHEQFLNVKVSKVWNNLT